MITTITQIHYFVNVNYSELVILLIYKRTLTQLSLPFPRLAPLLLCFKTALPTLVLPFFPILPKTLILRHFKQLFLELLTNTFDLLFF